MLTKLARLAARTSAKTINTAPKAKHYFKRLAEETKAEYVKTRTAQ